MNKVLDIDKLAREAQRHRKQPPQKLNEREEPNEQDVPSPLNWQIIVEPIRPQERTQAGIIIEAMAQEAEEANINVGKVVAIGPLAMMGKTSAGLDLSVDAARVKVGVYVQWQRYVGLKIKVRQDSGQDRLFLALEATDLVQIPNDHTRLRFWV